MMLAERESAEEARSGTEHPLRSEAPGQCGEERTGRGGGRAQAAGATCRGGDPSPGCHRAPPRPMGYLHRAAAPPVHVTLSSPSARLSRGPQLPGGVSVYPPAHRCPSVRFPAVSFRWTEAAVTSRCASPTSLPPALRILCEELGRLGAMETPPRVPWVPLDLALPARMYMGS